jgi:hypothetical protein
MGKTDQTPPPMSTADLIEVIADQVVRLRRQGERIVSEPFAPEQERLANVRHRMLLSLKEMTDAAVQNSDETGGF